MAAVSAFVEALKLITTNQEAVQEPFELSNWVSDTVSTPMDLTGLTFKSEVKASRSITAPALLVLEVEVEGDPADGKIVFRASEVDMEPIAPGTYFYDLNIKPTGGEPDCLFIAPFVIEPGVSKWSA
jgi:hypothetical protein